jgi:hypothetical protein
MEIDMLKHNIIIVIGMVIVAGNAKSEQIPNKEQLISFYEKSINAPIKAVYTVDSNQTVEGMEWPANVISHFTMYRDELRKSVDGFGRITLKKTNEVVDETNMRRILDKRSIMVMSSTHQPLFVYLDSEKERKKGENAFYATLGGGIIIEGFMIGLENQRISEYLRTCPNLIMRDKTEDIEGNPTYAIEGQGNQGKIILWLDPVKGYRPRKVELYKTSESLYYGQPLASYHSERPELKDKIIKDYKAVCDSINIEDVNGTYFITSGRMAEIQIFTDGSKYVLASNFNISDINLSPDFEVSKPFEIKAPDGTQVNDADFPGGKFEVRHGKIVSAGNSFEQIDKTIDELKRQ